MYALGGVLKHPRLCARDIFYKQHDDDSYKRWWGFEAR